MHRTELRFVLSAALASLVLASSAEARADAPETHDGFLLRLAPGIGYLSSSYAPSELTISGGAGVIDVALGGRVADNLILNADLWAASALSPTAKVGAQSQKLNDVTLQLTGIGVGLTYYFMPSNVYLAGSVGIAQYSLKIDGLTYETNTGWGVNGMVGKEWWVAGDWGVGIAGAVMYASVPDKVDRGRFGGPVIAALFTATYN